ncbi:hypothetical protein ACHAXM_002691 [Skeletonema potamos]
MPSTVKVRIKAARNLSSLTPTTPAAATTATATSQSKSNNNNNSSISPRLTSVATNTPATSSSSSSSSAPAVILPDTHVTVTLGGHSAVAEYDEDNNDGTNMTNPMTTTTTTDTTHSNRLLLAHHKRDGSNLLFNFGGIGSNNNNNSNSHDQLPSVSNAATITTTIIESSATTDYNINESGNTTTTTTNNNNANTPRTSRCYSARTRTIPRSANPIYNQEFRFEVADDTLLQDEPLLFHVWEEDNNTSSNNKKKQNSGSIGLVYLDLNPLLMRTAMNDDDDGKDGDDNTNNKVSSGGGGGGEDRKRERSSTLESNKVISLGNSSGGGGGLVGGTGSGNSGGGAGGEASTSSDRTPGVIDGWFPLYDTLGGVRGELELSVKLNFIGDVNPFRDSSAGVQLFPFSKLDGNSGYTVSHVFGFVEELVVADDPEFEWSDNFNQARASHETRQTLMYLLDAKVRRRMCKKVLEMGGNAVLGYYQNFDMEGDSGLVARTYGTCVLIEKKEIVDIASSEQRMIKASARGDDDERALVSKNTPRQDMARSTGMILTRMSEATAAAARQREGAQEEVQLLTMKDFGPRVRVRIGGLVTARSVKFLGKLASKLSDQETRDGWWSELRDEVRSHARSLCCSHVIGYTESSTIHDDVCVLSITGTAATVRGLPDLAQAQRMWAEWEVQQHEIISRVERRQRHHRIRSSYPGDSSPGSVISTSLQTPFSEAVSDGDERLMIGSPIDVDSPKGQMHMKGSIKQVPFSGKAMKEAKLERNAQRLERRLRRMGVGKKNNKRAESRYASDIDKSSFVSDVLLRARLGRPCSYCHVPYHHRLAPFQNMKLVPCLLCGKKWVPEIILATVEPPARLPVRGSGVFIQARVCRVRPRATGESDALAVSEALPFLEFDLARQLMLKLKILGRNAAFSCKLN